MHVRQEVRRFLPGRTVENPSKKSDPPQSGHTMLLRPWQRVPVSPQVGCGQSEVVLLDPQQQPQAQNITESRANRTNWKSTNESTSRQAASPPIAAGSTSSCGLVVQKPRTRRVAESIGLGTKQPRLGKITAGTGQPYAQVQDICKICPGTVFLANRLANLTEPECARVIRLHMTAR